MQKTEFGKARIVPQAVEKGRIVKDACLEHSASESTYIELQ